MNNVNKIVTFINNLPSVEDKYSYLKLLQNSSPDEFGEVKKVLTEKGFNISDKKLGEATPMSEERAANVFTATIASSVAEELGLDEEQKAAVLAEVANQVQQASNSDNRGFGGEDLAISAKWLGAASAALTAGGVALMRDDLSLGSVAGSVAGIAGGYFAADYLDTKLAAKSGFVRYLAALSTGAACGAAGQFLGSFTQEKLFSKEEGVDININIQGPGESQVLDQLAVVDYC